MNSIAFVGQNTTAKGTWQGVFGADGYELTTLPPALPPYAATIFTGSTPWTWTASTTDVRGLQNGASRLAACWYSTTSFSIDLTITDGNTHEFSLYFVDWDSTTRAQTVTIADGDTGTILDTRNVAAFNGGVWYTWNVTGHVKITITRTGGANAVVSGILFGPAGVVTVPVNPPTGTLTVTPAAVAAGSSATLAWSTANATTATLNGATVALSGTQTVSPASTTLYTLSVSGAGGSNTATATLVVTPAVLNTTLGVGPAFPLTADPTDIGPVTEARLAWDLAPPADTDVDQNQVADCYFLAPILSLIHAAPARARPLVADLGDGTYGCAFVRAGVRTVVRTSADIAQFADQPQVDGVAAIALLEKSYAHYRTGANTYASLNEGNATAAMQDLGLVANGNVASAYTSATLLSLVAAQLAAGKVCVIDTLGIMAQGNGWVASHTYALIPGSTAGTFKVLNPWGYGDIDDVTFATILANCNYVHYEM